MCKVVHVPESFRQQQASLVVSWLFALATSIVDRHLGHLRSLDDGENSDNVVLA